MGGHDAGVGPKWQLVFLNVTHCKNKLASAPFPVNKHRGPPARAAGHRENRKIGSFQSVLSIPRGCSAAHSLRSRAVDVAGSSRQESEVFERTEKFSLPRTTTDRADQKPRPRRCNRVLQDRGIPGTKTTRLFRRSEEETGHPRPCPVLGAELEARGRSDNAEDTERILWLRKSC